MTRMILTGATILTPGGPVADKAVLIEDGRIAALVDTNYFDANPIGAEADGRSAAPASDSGVRNLGGGWLLPGFIDTQVNGGGGVLLNDQADAEGIAAIAAAHRRFGTTGLLPTLISDDLAKIARAMDAVDEAVAQGVPGVLGLHIEGPFINGERRGIHEARFMRPLDEEALALLTRPGRGVRLVTLAPECVPPGAIRALRDAGVIVAGGHSMADYATATRALAEGLNGFTHLFNAMTQLGSREPGLVGAALADRRSHFGLIVDGHHVHPATLGIALRARGLDGAMLVTDAMPPAGTDMEEFALQGRRIFVRDGALRSADGTLAGSALTMDAAFRNSLSMLGLSMGEASLLASANPAAFLGLNEVTGAIRPGLAADLVHLDDALTVQQVWTGGRQLDGAG